jgi:hypothetical protein
MLDPSEFETRHHHQPRATMMPKYEFSMELMNGNDWLTSVDCEADIQIEDDGSWSVASIAHWSEDRSKLNPEDNCFARAFVPIDRTNCMGQEIYKQAMATLSLEAHAVKVEAQLLGPRRRVKGYRRLTAWDLGIGQYGPYQNKGLRT